MASSTNTTSWAFPNILDPVRNEVSILHDEGSVSNRVRLLILTDPTELYNEPTFGVGLRRYLWQYNTSNTKAIIQDRIRDELRMFEPSVVAEETQFAAGLLFTEGQMDTAPIGSLNQLKMTVGLKTLFGDELKIDLNDTHLQSIIDEAQSKYFT